MARDIGADKFLESRRGEQEVHIFCGALITVSVDCHCPYNGVGNAGLFQLLHHPRHRLVNGAGSLEEHVDLPEALVKTEGRLHHVLPSPVQRTNVFTRSRNSAFDLYSPSFLTSISIAATGLSCTRL